MNVLRHRTLLAVAAALYAAPADGASTLDCIVEPKSRIELGSSEEGVIEAVLVARGDVVERGQVVARLESIQHELAARSARLRAEDMAAIRSNEARLAFREAEQSRAETLHRRNIVATKMLDEAKTETDLAASAVEQARLQQKIAAVELAQADERLKSRSIRSPADGIVLDVAMSAGEYVHEQATLMTIVELDPLHVEVFAPVRLYGRLEIGSWHPVTLQEPIGGTHRARVAVIDRVFDAASGTFGMRLELPNPALDVPAGIRCTLPLPE